MYHSIEQIETWIQGSLSRAWPEKTDLQKMAALFETIAAAL